MDTSLSKTLSYLLRHGAYDEGLSVDKQGFVPVNELIPTLRDKGWTEINEIELIRAVSDPDVERFEVKGSHIRATYGHSIDVDMDYPEIDPDFPLYHGTPDSSVDSILEEGLKPMNRQYVHLSRSIDEARRVGKRRDSDPTILYITEPETDHSRCFYEAGPVIVVDRLGPQWIHRKFDG